MSTFNISNKNALEEKNRPPGLNIESLSIDENPYIADTNTTTSASISRISDQSDSKENSNEHPRVTYILPIASPPHEIKEVHASEQKEEIIPPVAIDTTSQQVTWMQRIKKYIYTYFYRWLGQGTGKPEKIFVWKWSYLFTFIYILITVMILTFLHYFSGSGYNFSVAAYAASALLIFASPTSMVSQPRNVLLGQVISSFIGIVFRKLFIELPNWQNGLFFVAALASATSGFLMLYSGFYHPPATATAYSVVTGDAVIVSAGFYFIVSPAIASSIILVFLGCLFNNLDPTTPYPMYW